MKCESKPFKQIDREYFITSAEIKKLLGIKGEIQSMGLSCGRSPQNVDDGISANIEVWFINTKEIKPQTLDSKKES